MDTQLLAVLTVVSLSLQRIIELTDVVWERFAGWIELLPWIQKAYGLNGVAAAVAPDPAAGTTGKPAQPVSSATLISIRAQAKRFAIIVFDVIVGAILGRQILLQHNVAIQDIRDLSSLGYALMMGLLVASGAEGTNAIVKLLGKVGAKAPGA